MARFDQRLLMLCFLLFFGKSFSAAAITDPVDVAALHALYESLGYPEQLIGWNKTGGDPCADQSWKGVTCSGQSIISINVTKLGLGGFLSSEISNLFSLKELDMSHNKITGKFPHGLPPNSTSIDLSDNLLSGRVGNVFHNMDSLERLNLSFNNLINQLPPSLRCLPNLHELYLQNNHFDNDINDLRNLPLTKLNIDYNRFVGRAPPEFDFMPNLMIHNYNENLMNLRFLHKTPIYHYKDKESSPFLLADKNISHGLTPGAMAAIIYGALLLLAAIVLLLLIIKKSKPSDELVKEKLLHPEV